MCVKVIISCDWKRKGMCDFSIIALTKYCNKDPPSLKSLQDFSLHGSSKSPATLCVTCSRVTLMLSTQ